jgi:hypothetical protein
MPLTGSRGVTPLDRREPTFQPAQTGDYSGGAHSRADAALRRRPLHRRGQRYLTCVADHRSGTIVWCVPGRNSATLQGFFDQLGERRASIRAVSINMSGGDQRAIRAAVPQAEICVDAFHVCRLASRATDQIRRDEWNAHERSHPPTGRWVKGTRWSLLKAPERQTLGQLATLGEVQQANSRLYRAFLLREELQLLYHIDDTALAPAHLNAWLAWASKSRLAPFVAVARTLRAHRDWHPRRHPPRAIQRPPREPQLQDPPHQPPQLRLSLGARPHRARLSLLHRRRHRPVAMNFTPKSTGAPFMTIVMGLDHHRGSVTAEWLDAATGEVSRARAPAHRSRCADSSAALGRAWGRAGGDHLLEHRAGERVAVGPAPVGLKRPPPVPVRRFARWAFHSNAAGAERRNQTLRASAAAAAVGQRGGCPVDAASVSRVERNRCAKGGQERHLSRPSRLPGGVPCSTASPELSCARKWTAPDSSPTMVNSHSSSTKTSVRPGRYSRGAPLASRPNNKRYGTDGIFYDAVGNLVVAPKSSLRSRHGPSVRRDHGGVSAWLVLGHFGIAAIRFITSWFATWGRRPIVGVPL